MTLKPIAISMGDFKGDKDLSDKISDNVVDKKKPNILMVGLIVCILVYLAGPFIDYYYNPDTNQGLQIKKIITTPYHRIGS